MSKYFVLIILFSFVTPGIVHGECESLQTYPEYIVTRDIHFKILDNFKDTTLYSFNSKEKNSSLEFNISDFGQEINLETVYKKRIEEEISNSNGEIILCKEYESEVLGNKAKVAVLRRTYYFVFSDYCFVCITRLNSKSLLEIDFKTEKKDIQTFNHVIGSVRNRRINDFTAKSGFYTHQVLNFVSEIPDLLFPPATYSFTNVKEPTLEIEISIYGKKEEKPNIDLGGYITWDSRDGIKKIVNLQMGEIVIDGEKGMQAKYYIDYTSHPYLKEHNSVYRVEANLNSNKIFIHGSSTYEKRDILDECWKNFFNSIGKEKLH